MAKDVGYTLSIQESGIGASYAIQEGRLFGSLAEALTVVARMDKLWEAWADADFPELDEGDPIRHWEGCEVLADGSDGTCWMLEGDDKWVEVD